MTETRIVEHGTPVSEEDRNNKDLRIREVCEPRGDGVFVNGTRVQGPTQREPKPQDQAEVKAGTDAGQSNSEEGGDAE